MKQHRTPSGKNTSTTSSSRTTGDQTHDPTDAGIQVILVSWASGNIMPRWGNTLSSEEMWELVAYLKDLEMQKSK